MGNTSETKWSNPNIDITTSKHRSEKEFSRKTSNDLMIEGLKSISDPSLKSKLPEGFKFKNWDLLKKPEFDMMFLLSVVMIKERRTSILHKYDVAHQLALLNIYKEHGVFDADFYKQLMLDLKERNPNDPTFKKAKVEEHLLL